MCACSASAQGRCATRAFGLIRVRRRRTGAVRAIAEAFNRRYAVDGLGVDVSFFPDFHYTEKLSIAAAAQDMPDAFELDGPLVARFADASLLQVLDTTWSAPELEDFLPTIVRQ